MFLNRLYCRPSRVDQRELRSRLQTRIKIGKGDLANHRKLIVRLSKDIVEQGFSRDSRQSVLREHRQSA